VKSTGSSTNHLNGRKRSGLLYIWRGEAQFSESSGSRLTAQSGDLVFIPKGCRYKMQYTAPDTTFVLIDLKIYDHEGKDFLFSKAVTLLAKDNTAHRIAGIMTELERCSAVQSLSAVFRRKELVYRLLGTVYEIGSIPSIKLQKHQQIFAGVLLLEQSYLENLPVSKFAEASGISISLFRTLFSKQFGMSPVQYRNRLRIDRATVILSEGSCTVSEAAYACGFENIGYFCRCYNKFMGETPMETKLRSN
jgi:AraC-like DNA-binding protein